ncbi:MAG: SpoVG family protein [Candidatus Izemoplasmatales bacterium]
MPAKSPSKSTGAKTSPKPTEQAAKMPVRASINWMNTKDDGNVRATASLTIGGAFAVHGIKVISGQKGDFVSMPSYKSGDSYKDIFHAVTAEAREQMNDAVMKAYEQKLSEEMSLGFDGQGEVLSEDAGMKGMNQ